MRRSERARRRLIAGAAILCVVWGVQLTGVAAALPAIVSELGEARLYGWVPTGYMLAEVVGTPVVAWLADRYGWRCAALGAMGLLAIGAAAAACATALPQLVAIAALQGLGAGGGYAILLAALVEPDVPAAEIGRAQGIILAAYGVGQLVGPLVAEAALRLGSWRWLYAGAIPPTVVGALLVAPGLRGRRRAAAAALDVAGLGVLVLLGLLLAAGAAGALPVPVAYAGAVIVLGAGLAIERRVARPLVPRAVLADRLLLTITLVLVAGEALAFCLLAFLPLFAAAAYSSTELTGRAILPAVLGRTVAALAVGALMRRVATPRLAAAGLGLTCVSVAALGLFRGGGLPFPALAGVGALLGAGLGLAYTPLLVLIQRRVPREDLIGATAFETFMSAIGSVLAASLASVVLGELLGAGASGGLAAGFGFFWGLLAALAALAALCFALVRGRLIEEG